MKSYLKMADHYIKTPSEEACLFNYDAFVLKTRDKRILTNHLLFQPEQMPLMDPTHPNVQVNAPKGIKQVPLVYWPTYMQKLALFTLSEKDHEKNLNLLKEHTVNHKYNALCYKCLLDYIDLFKVRHLVEESHYLMYLYNYVKIDYLCDDSYIDLVINSPDISIEKKCVILQRRSEKFKLKSNWNQLLKSNDLLHNTD